MQGCCSDDAYTNSSSSGGGRALLPAHRDDVADAAHACMQHLISLQEGLSERGAVVTDVCGRSRWGGERGRTQGMRKG